MAADHALFEQNLHPFSVPGRPYIVILHPQEITRESQARLISHLCPSAEIASCRSATELPEIDSQGVVRIVVAELNLRQEECGLSAFEHLRKKLPQTKILVLSPLSERQMGLAAFRVGADAYLPTSASIEELTAALNALLRGQGYISTEMAAVLADEAQGKNPRNGFARLSPRELEVMRHLIWGMQLKSVAAKLGLNIRTASCYKRNALNKLGMDSIAEVVRYSSEQGLTV